MWRALADGLRQGDGGRHMITYHPCGWRSSSQYFHNDAWLAFNMIEMYTYWTALSSRTCRSPFPIKASLLQVEARGVALQKTSSVNISRLFRSDGRSEPRKSRQTYILKCIRAGSRGAQERLDGPLRFTQLERRYENATEEDYGFASSQGQTASPST